MLGAAVVTCAGALLVMVVLVVVVLWVGIVGFVMVIAPNGLGDVVAQTLMLAASMKRTRTTLIVLTRSLFNYVLALPSQHAPHWRFGKRLAFYV